MVALPERSAQSADDALEPEGRGPRRTLAIGCVLAGTALVVHSAAVINLALPALAASFDVTAAASVHVITIYQLALVMALLPCAALGERLGHRRVFRLGVLLFTLASGLCALAPTLHWLLAARFVQGLGGAAVMALGVALLRYAVPRRQLAAAIGWNALTVALSAAVAPSTGAFLLSSAPVCWLFASHLPLGVAVLLATRGLPAVVGIQGKLDAISMVLSAASFASLVFALERILLSPAAGGLALAVSALILTVLVRRELPKRSPFIPLDLLRVQPFRVAVIASVCCFAGQSAALVALPFHLQHGLAQDVVTTGLLMVPWPLSVAVTAPVAGRLADRVPTAWLCAAGGACLALGLAAAALSPLQAGACALLPCIILSGVGFGLFQVPNNRTMLLAVPRARSAAAGASQATARLFGQTLGAIMMTLLFTLTPSAMAPRIGLAASGLLTLSAASLSMLRAAPNARTLDTSPLPARGGSS